MLLIAIVAVALGLSIFFIVVLPRQKKQKELKESSIDVDTLHGLIEAKQKILVFDVRQPLDLLAYSEIIPGSVRIPPKELLENPSLIPKDEDVVVYCTCEGDKTSREVVHQARMLKFMRLKLLRGGLAAWKSKGYPVQKYEQPFRLDTAI